MLMINMQGRSCDTDLGAAEDHPAAVLCLRTCQSQLSAPWCAWSWSPWSCPPPGTRTDQSPGLTASQWSAPCLVTMCISGHGWTPGCQHWWSVETLTGASWPETLMVMTMLSMVVMRDIPWCLVTLTRVHRSTQHCCPHTLWNTRVVNTINIAVVSDRDGTILRIIEIISKVNIKMPRPDNRFISWLNDFLDKLTWQLEWFYENYHHQCYQMIMESTCSWLIT